MSCYLRVFGDKFDVEGYAKNPDFDDVHYYVKGQSKTPNSNPTKNLHTTSGITVTASDAEQTDFAGQILESIQFLKAKKKAISRLVHFKGVEEARLDFGIERREGFGQFDYFPPELLLLVGQLGIGIELSQYQGEYKEPAKPKAKAKPKQKLKKK
jgi:hypothetical protein